MKITNDLDKSHISGMVGMKVELKEIEKRMMETMSVDNYSEC